METDREDGRRRKHSNKAPHNVLSADKDKYKRIINKRKGREGKGTIRAKETSIDRKLDEIGSIEKNINTSRARTRERERKVMLNFAIAAACRENTGER